MFQEGKRKKIFIYRFFLFLLVFFSSSFFHFSFFLSSFISVCLPEKNMFFQILKKENDCRRFSDRFDNDGKINDNITVARVNELKRLYETLTTKPKPAAK